MLSFSEVKFLWRRFGKRLLTIPSIASITVKSAECRYSCRDVESGGIGHTRLYQIVSNVVSADRKDNENKGRYFTNMDKFRICKGCYFDM